MRKTLLTISLMMLLVPSQALACSYPDPGDAVDMVEGAEVVFAGIVEEILDSDVTLIFDEKNKVIGNEQPTKPTRGVTLRVTPVEVYKGYVPETIQLITNISCSRQYWMVDTGRLRIITANRVSWGDSEFEYYEPLGQLDPKQRDLINYLEKGIEPEIDCPTIKLPNSVTLEGAKKYKVRCHRLPRNIDDPFRLIPSRPLAQ